MAISATFVESQDMLLGTNPRREIVHPDNSITQIKMARAMKKRDAAISAPCRGPVCKKERWRIKSDSLPYLCDRCILHAIVPGLCILYTITVIPERCLFLFNAVPQLSAPNPNTYTVD